MAHDSKSTFYDVVLLLRFFTNNQQFPSSCLFCGAKITSLHKRVIINSPLCRLQPKIFFSIRLLLKSNTLISSEFDRKTLCYKNLRLKYHYDYVEYVVNGQIFLSCIFLDVELGCYIRRSVYRIDVYDSY